MSYVILTETSSSFFFLSSYNAFGDLGPGGGGGGGDCVNSGMSNLEA